VSSHLKGFPSSQKSSQFKYATLEPVRASQNGLSAVAHTFVTQVAVDAVEANSTTSQIVATAHAALVGDVIHFTSGALNGLEFKVLSVDTNNIYLVEDASVAPAVADTFEILRHKYPVVDASGNLTLSSGPIQFVRDGVNQQVIEDTVTPANNRPLPVKLTGFSGDVSINAANLNLDVQLSDQGANADVVRVGDGTTQLQIKVEDQASTGGEAGLVLLGVRNDAGTTPVSADGDYQAMQFDANGNLRVFSTEQATAADASAGLPAVSKVIAGYDGTNVRTIHTDASGDVQVDLASSIPAGTNNIGDVDVLTEPATSADAAAGLPAVSKVIAGYDGTNVRTIHTDNAGDVQVDLASPIPAGTNNIGDVDVLTEPATAADAAVGLPAVSKVMAGYDGTNVRTVKTDASGNLIVAQGTSPWVNNLTQVGGSNVTLGQKASAASFPVVLASDQSSLPVSFSGRAKVNLIRNDYSLTNVTTGAYVQLVASTAATINLLDVFDSSGNTMVLAVGGAGSEVDQFYISPGGNGRIELSIPSGSRISVKAVSANSTVGELVINCFS
jgi:hypothetical protein